MPFVTLMVGIGGWSPRNMEQIGTTDFSSIRVVLRNNHLKLLAKILIMIVMVLVNLSFPRTAIYMLPQARYFLINPPILMYSTLIAARECLLPLIVLKSKQVVVL